MLKELSIRQFAIVENIHLSFDQGFHVLTGETGAGKSILIDALGLIIGGRASNDFVRHGAQKAEIEAYFEFSADHPAISLLQEWEIETDEEKLIVRREIAATGKSTCRLNGRLITLAMLKQLGSYLIQLHGQHEHTGLLQVEEHLAWLDQFAGIELLQKLETYNELFHSYQQISKSLKRLDLDQQEMERRIDMLQFQVTEIKDARLVLGEEGELEQEVKRLAGGEKLLSRVSSAYQLLSGDNGGIAQIGKAASSLHEVEAYDPSIQATLETVEAAIFQLEEVARMLDLYQDGLEFSPERLYELQDRLHTIRQLKRKYGESVEEILLYLEQAEQELDRLTNVEENRDQLHAEQQKLHQQLLVVAGELTQLRKQAASQLETQVETQLADLMMGASVFHVSFYPEYYRAGTFTPMGMDQVEFQLSPGPGEPLRPLAKVASGGELSRIMLALKCIFSGRDQIHTLIFDEVDTGVSGRAAQAIAEKIAALASVNQILCVTHLPQVACMADVHFYVTKEISTDKTSTKVSSLDKSGRVLELSRMLGGAEVTARTKQHAAEMIFLAEKVKENF
jgi:DNA repair protein RecN (Recombination protein N)